MSDLARELMVEALFDREHRGREQLAQELIAGATNAKAVLITARIANGSLDEQALRLLELGSLAADGRRGGGRRHAQSSLCDGDRPAWGCDGLCRDDGPGGRRWVSARTAVARSPCRRPRQGGGEGRCLCGCGVAGQGGRGRVQSPRAPSVDEMGKVMPMHRGPERPCRAVRVRGCRARLPGAFGGALCPIVGLAAIGAAEERLQPRSWLRCSRLSERSARACAVGGRAVLDRSSVQGHV
jgi:hypothetical protein